MQKWKPLFPLFLQLVRFGLVGALNTLLTYAVYWLLLRAGLDGGMAWLAWLLSYLLGMGCSLALNTRWTFAQREPLSGGQVFRFVLVNLASLAVSTAMVALMTRGLGWEERLSGLLATPFSLAVNFAGNRLFVFRINGVAGRE